MPQCLGEGVMAVMLATPLGAFRATSSANDRALGDEVLRASPSAGEGENRGQRLARRVTDRKDSLMLWTSSSPELTASVLPTRV